MNRFFSILLLSLLIFSFSCNQEVGVPEKKVDVKKANIKNSKRLRLYGSTDRWIDYDDRECVLQVIEILNDKIYIDTCYKSPRSGRRLSDCVPAT